jgi:hypothetical protein
MDALLCVTIPYSILVIPIKSKPIAKGRIKNTAVQSGKETTMIPNTIVKPPKTIFPIGFYFGRLFSSISASNTNNMIDKRNTRSVTPALG